MRTAAPRHHLSQYQSLLGRMAAAFLTLLMQMQIMKFLTLRHSMCISQHRRPNLLIPVILRGEEPYLEFMVSILAPRSMEHDLQPHDGKMRPLANRQTHLYSMKMISMLQEEDPPLSHTIFHAIPPVLLLCLVNQVCQTFLRQWRIGSPTQMLRKLPTLDHCQLQALEVGGVLQWQLVWEHTLTLMNIKKSLTYSQ